MIYSFNWNNVSQEVLRFMCAHEFVYVCLYVYNDFYNFIIICL